MKTIIILLLLLSSSYIRADCQGCCSSHNGVMCSGGATMCGDGSSLSSTCAAKGCNACGGGTVTPPTLIYFNMNKILLHSHEWLLVRYGR